MTEASAGTNPLVAFSDSLASLVESAERQVVRVNGRGGYGSTSGLVVAPEKVLAIDHTVENEEGLTVNAAGGRSLPASVAGRDPSTDLVLLSVPGLDLPVAQPATRPARVGELALVVARRDAPVVTIGVVARSGIDMGRAALGPVLALSQPPFPGISGAPALAADGSVLGIVHATLQRGSSRVISAETAWRVAGTLAERGSVPRPYLGIATTVVRGAGRWGEPMGLMVLEVDADSGAGRAGLQVGDLIVRANGKPIGRNANLVAGLGPDAIGSEIALDVLRAGEVRQVKVVVGQREAGR